MIERIKKLIAYNNMNPSRFADHIGVPRSTISHILSGRNNPSLELVMKILDAFPELRTEWLVRGKGVMSLQSQTLFPDESLVREELSAADSSGAGRPDEGRFVAEMSTESDAASEKAVPQSKEVTPDRGSAVKMILVYADGSFSEHASSLGRSV